MTQDQIVGLFSEGSLHDEGLTLCTNPEFDSADLYLFWCESAGMFKAGISNKVEKRLFEVTDPTSINFDKSIYFRFPTRDWARAMELALHARLKSGKHHVKPKVVYQKFNVSSGHTEWFYNRAHAEALAYIFNQTKSGLMPLVKQGIMSSDASIMASIDRRACNIAARLVRDSKSEFSRGPDMGDDWSDDGHLKSNGYRYFSDCETRAYIGIFKETLVHRMLWLLRKGDIPAGMDVAFINGEKTDIRLSNLRLVSSSIRKKELFKSDKAKAGKVKYHESKNHAMVYEGDDGLKYKLCKGCGETKLTSCFYIDKKAGIAGVVQTLCKPCSNAHKNARSKARRLHLNGGVQLKRGPKPKAKIQS